MELVSFGRSLWNNNVAENIRTLVLEEFVNLFYEEWSSAEKGSMI